MPRVNLNKEKYLISDAHDKLKQECRSFGIPLKIQADACGCTKQNLSSHYKNNTLSYRQYLLIHNLVEEKRREREEERLRNG